MGFSRAVLACVSVLVFAACRATPTPSGGLPAELGAAPVAIAVEPPAPAPPPKATTIVASVAYFEDSQLDECMDYVVTPQPGQGSALTEGLETLIASQQTGQRKGDVLRIGKSCAEQFASRTVFATCVFEQEEKRGRVTVTSRYYDVRTVESSDAHMRDCLSAKGDWVPNTDEQTLAAARRQDRMKELRKIVKESEQALAD